MPSGDIVFGYILKQPCGHFVHTAKVLYSFFFAYNGKQVSITYHRTQKEIRTLRLPALGSDFYCLVPVAGVEPARGISPTDFESVTSANSITPACFVRGNHAQNIIRIFCVFVKGITEFVLTFPSACCS